MIELDIDQRSEATVVAVRGRLDLVAAKALREGLQELIGQRTLLVLDFGPTEFIDSSGLGAVVGSLKTARQAGGDLRIANVEGQVGMVLGLTNLDRVLRPYPTVEEAIAGGS